jgi:hypothetical protein
MFHERSMNVPEDQNVQEASGTFRNESFVKLAVSGIVLVCFKIPTPTGPKSHKPDPKITKTLTHKSKLVNGGFLGPLTQNV